MGAKSSIVWACKAVIVAAVLTLAGYGASGAQAMDPPRAQQLSKRGLKAALTLNG